MLNALLHKIAFTCKDATFFMEKDNTNKISFLQQSRLQLHLKICKACKAYQQNSKLIERIFETYQYGNSNNQENIEQLKVKIFQNLPKTE